MFTVLFLVIAACSTPKLQGFKEPKMIERAEVIRAQKDCIDAKMRPVIQAVDLKPFLLRGGTEKTLIVAARMQTLPAPVGRR